MAYTPELSQRHSSTLRRLAWAYGKPMTKTLEAIFDWIGKAVDPGKVCKECRDQSACEECAFYRCPEQKNIINR